MKSQEASISPNVGKRLSFGDYTAIYGYVFLLLAMQVLLFQLKEYSPDRIMGSAWLVVILHVLYSTLERDVGILGLVSGLLIVTGVNLYTGYLGGDVTWLTHGISFVLVFAAYGFLVWNHARRERISA